MKIIEKFILFMKNKFHKQEIKLLEPPLNTDKKKDFVQSLKITNIKKQSKITTLVCEGSGLGILGKISY